MKKSLWLTLIFALTLRGGDKPWTWKDKAGNVRTRADLEMILEGHERWLSGRINHSEELSEPQRSTRADLTNAILRDADLDLANLTGAILTGVNFSGAILTGARLEKAKLNGATLVGANLRKAHLIGADLTGGLLNGAELNGAELLGATLTDVNFIGADLTGVTLMGSDLTGVFFEPKVIPTPESILYAKGLGYLRFRDPGKLAAFRKSLFEAGFNSEGRDVIAAFHRHDQSWLQKVAFDWTCEWGTNPERPLIAIGLLALLCTFVYWVGLHLSRKGGLYLIATGQRITTDKGRKRVLHISIRGPQKAALPAALVMAAPSLTHVEPKVLSFAAEFPRLLRQELRAFGTSVLFSLMSVFNLGFQGLNFGLWMRMLQTREFDIRPRGWMRTVSGIQSLLGLMLLALSVLSYLGKAFD